MPFPFPCIHVIREWLQKKTQIEKKETKLYLEYSIVFNSLCVIFSFLLILL